jgi:hypothetical protein
MNEVISQLINAIDIVLLASILVQQSKNQNNNVIFARKKLFLPNQLWNQSANF